MRLRELIQTLGNATATFFWRRRARATARKNRELRQDLVDLAEIQAIQHHALKRAASHFRDIEWMEMADHAFIFECPECGTRWRRCRSVTPPDHDEGCQIGRTAAVVRHAIAAKENDDLGAPYQEAEP